MPEFPRFEEMFPAFIKAWMSPTAPTTGNTNPAATPRLLGQGENTPTPTPNLVGGDDTGGPFDSEKARSAFRYNLAQNLMGQLFPEVHPVVLGALLRRSFFPQPDGSESNGGSGDSWLDGWGDVFGKD